MEYLSGDSSDSGDDLPPPPPPPLPEDVRAAEVRAEEEDEPPPPPPLPATFDVAADRVVLSGYSRGPAGAHGAAGQATSLDVEWVDDDKAPNCMRCDVKFSLIRRRHHCRLCGYVVCNRCSPHRVSSFGRRVRSCRMCSETHSLPAVMDAARLVPAGTGGGAVIAARERREAAAGPGKHRTVGNDRVFSHDRSSHYLGSGVAVLRAEASRRVALLLATRDAAGAASPARRLAGLPAPALRALLELAAPDGGDLYGRALALRQHGYAKARQQQQAVPLLEEAAALGHPGALFTLGECCRDGRGVAESEVRAFQCFERGAARGHAPSMYWTGHCLFRGYGTRRDKTRSAELFAHAAAAFAAGAARGDADSAYRLAIAHATGHGAEKNPARALELHAEAAAAGHAPALFTLAQAYHRGALGAAANRDRARELYSQCAELGHPGAANLARVV